MPRCHIKEDGRSEKVIRPAPCMDGVGGEGLSLYENFGQSEAKGIVKTIGLPDPKEAFSVPPTGIVVE